MEPSSIDLRKTSLKIFSYLLLILVTQYLTACGGGGGENGFTESSRSTSQENSSLPFSSLSSSSLASAASSISSSFLNSSSLSSSSASSTRSSSSEIRVDPLVILVAEKNISESILEIGYIPEEVEAGESFTLYWTAYSTEGVVENVIWEQISGPEIELLKSSNGVLINTDQSGDVLIKVTATDAQNNVRVKEIGFKVVAAFSEKAQLISGNSDGVGIDLVIVGDGFLIEDQDKLKEAAYETIEFLFRYDENRLKHYQSMFNLWVIDSVSSTRVIPDRQSGNTLFGSFFYCGEIERLLCVDGSKVLTYVSSHVPQYDQILVLVNSEKYGGAGGSISTASLNGFSKDVAIHELGHSLAGLADEYSDNDNQTMEMFEPIEPNVTLNRNPREVKWNYWYENPNSIPGVDRFIFAASDVGYFEGGKYQTRGVWRPLENSFMRSLGGPFGAVNTEAWALSIWRHYQGNNLVVPANRLLTLSDKPVIFHIHPPLNQNHLTIQWWVNDVLVSKTNKEYFLILSQLDQSVKSVRVQIEDATGMIRRDSNQISQINYEWVPNE
jgi:IgA Peptidase M64